MKAVNFLNYALITIIFGLSTLHLQAQENALPDLKGWLDDKYYLEERITDKGETQIWKVNAKTGRAKIHTETPYSKEVNDALPADRPHGKL